MSHQARSTFEAVQRLGLRDPNLTTIYLFSIQLTDAALAELVDCLLAHPDVVTRVLLAANKLTDETGIKLARYVAASSTIQTLDLDYNQLGTETYLALAAALRVNSSLQVFYLSRNQAVDRTRVDAAFMEALQFNPHRPAKSRWCLYSFGAYDTDYKRLKHAAKLGHPSLQSLLLAMTFDQISNKNTKPASSSCIMW